MSSRDHGRIFRKDSGWNHACDLGRVCRWYNEPLQIYSIGAMVGVKFHSGLRMVMLELFTREEQREPNRDTWLLCPKLKSSSPWLERRVLEANLIA